MKPFSSASRRAALLLLVTLAGGASALGCSSSDDSSSSSVGGEGGSGGALGGASSSAGHAGTSTNNAGSAGVANSAGTSAGGSAAGGTSSGGTGGEVTGGTGGGATGGGGTSAGGAGGGAAGGVGGTLGGGGSAPTGGAAGSAGAGGAHAGSGGGGTGGTLGGSGGTGGNAGGVGKIVINEVESNGDVTDWCELYNVGSAPIDISGYIFRDNKDSDGYAVPAGTIVQPGGYYVLNELDSTAFPIGFDFGLGAPDSTRLFLPDGTTPVDSYAWDTHAAVTYGRCPNGTGDFVNTVASTKDAANSCPTSGGSGGAGGTGGVGGAGGSGGAGGDSSFFITWPGQNNVAIVDNLNEFADPSTGGAGGAPAGAADGTNVSGLIYDHGTTDVMWAVQNGPSRVYRLLKDGDLWVPDTANNWAQGHTITYVDGTGGPDSEGITQTAYGDPSLYVSTERNNLDKNTPLLKVLQIDATATTATVAATREWNLTSDYNQQAPTDANLGLEAIAFIPDTYLTSKGFWDENKGALYNPANYPDHAAGVFFVGLEKDGSIRGYILNHADGTSFVRVANLIDPNKAVMDLSWDRDVGYLWAACDDTCNDQTVVFDIDTTAGSATKGHFIAKQGYAKPSTMVSGSVNFLNNEGFAVTPETLCVNNFKPVYYSDDSNDAGHALRRDSIPCGAFLGH